jgi:hypothetical protein
MVSPDPEYGVPRSRPQQWPVDSSDCFPIEPISSWLVELLQHHGVHKYVSFSQRLDYEAFTGNSLETVEESKNASSGVEESGYIPSQCGFNG